MSQKKYLDRRDFIKASLAATALLPLTGCARFRSITQQNDSSASVLKDLKASGANVLFIAVDDLNDFASPWGGYPGKVVTPNIERLAAMGVTFKNAYCPVPWCAPSRMATLSGVAPTRSGYYGDAPANSSSALSSATMLPQFFKQAGYRTAAGGKVFHGWYLYGPSSSRTFDPSGQSQYFDIYQSYADEPRPDARLNHLPIDVDQFDWGSSFDPPVSAMEDYKIAQWAAQFLQTQSASQPFFLAVGLYKPHLPWYVPKAYYDMYPLDRIQLPLALPGNQDDRSDLPQEGLQLSGAEGDHARILAVDPTTLLEWKRAIQAYLAAISFSDYCLGLVLDALEKSAHANNTVIVLWSDNGFMLGEKMGWRKFKMWDKSARVPMIIATPNRGHAGAKCERVVSLMDLYPTLAEVCLNQIPNQVDGNSLARLLKNPQSEWCYGAVTSFPTNSQDPTQIAHSVRTENFRLIRYATGAEELYDHRTDSNEWYNLLHPKYGKATQLKDVRNALASLLPKPRT